MSWEQVINIIAAARGHGEYQPCYWQIFKELLYSHHCRWGLVCAMFEKKKDLGGSTAVLYVRK